MKMRMTVSFSYSNHSLKVYQAKWIRILENFTHVCFKSFCFFPLNIHMWKINNENFSFYCGEKRSIQTNIYRWIIVCTNKPSVNRLNKLLDNVPWQRQRPWWCWNLIKIIKSMEKEYWTIDNRHVNNAITQ